VSSIEPNDSGGEVDGRQAISDGFVVARGDGTELFEVAEEILDQVARLIKFSVKAGEPHAVWLGWDYR
jgi:hypothetical protein